MCEFYLHFNIHQLGGRISQLEDGLDSRTVNFCSRFVARADALQSSQRVLWAEAYLLDLVHLPFAFSDPPSNSKKHRHISCPSLFGRVLRERFPSCIRWNRPRFVFKRRIASAHAVIFHLSVHWTKPRTLSRWVHQLLYRVALDILRPHNVVFCPRAGNCLSCPRNLS